LLARLFDPDEGRVLFDGRDLREVRLSSLREQVALVPQNPYLFDVSVRDNVALGKLGAAPTEVEAALRTAALDVKNELRPAGLDTIVGEQGAKLSGGQAQRVAVARAFVRDASLLLLDEATASLDARAEAELLDAVERFRSRGKTVIFATHRATAAERADLTIALRDGRLIQVEQRGGAQRAQLA
jgi:ATP-binding cassette subfamily B protein